MRSRVFHRLLLLLAWAGSAGCDAFSDDDLVPPASVQAGNGGQGGSSGSSGNGGAGAGGDGPMCIEAPEACNDEDDDCDGDVDEETADACDAIVLNSVTECVRVGDEKRCVGQRCNPGYDDCDGNPANGCEAVACTCRPCADDAGMDDAGNDDSGAPDAGDAGD